MISEEQYREAVEGCSKFEEVIQQYQREKADAFRLRMETNPIFSMDELVFSADLLCPCGYGMAYPKDCGPNHYWDCSAILRGVAADVKHCTQQPFITTSIKSEYSPGPQGTRATTRGVFVPKIEGDGTAEIRELIDKNGGKP